METKKKQMLRKWAWNLKFYKTKSTSPSSNNSESTVCPKKNELLKKFAYDVIMFLGKR